MTTKKGEKCCFQKIKSEFGPPIEHRLDKLELIELLGVLEFSNIASIDIGENFYGITAVKY